MNISDAIEYVKKADKAKFDSTIELHINCALDKAKQESVRFTVSLPHGTGKSKKIAVMAGKKVEGADLLLSEDDIDRLVGGQLRPKIDFDVLIVEPRFMSKLAKAAKVLGPAGVMPNPKNGTVTDDVEKAAESFKKGRVEVRSETGGCVIHTVLGKKGFTTSALVENFEEIMGSLTSNKPSKAPADWIKSVYISATMSPSVEVSF